MDVTIRIGGAAGQGIQTIGGILAKTFSRAGYHVFTNQDYMSRVRGGHNFYQIRVADHPLAASVDRVDLLIALDGNTIPIHGQDLTQESITICDTTLAEEAQSVTGTVLALPLTELTERNNLPPIMTNTVLVGATFGIFAFDATEMLPDIIKAHLPKRKADTVPDNMTAIRTGFDHARENCTPPANFKLAETPQSGLLLINGNQAIGLGALLAGCKFYAAYPMTPSTSIMTYLAGKAERYGLVVEQAEDELAAINMAIGASFAGVRAMTGTSGGGFALMTEGVSLAGITETPVVIAEVQRPGPATGLPTRTEQGDLLFAIHGGHGEFPRIVFTPGTPEEALRLTSKGFDLAEKYQIPVIILSDQYLADAEWTYENLSEKWPPYRDYRLRQPELDKIDTYRRYAWSDNGVSPLAEPGASPHLVVEDSDEHDQDGHIIEDAPTRIAMVEKRLLKKLPLIRREISPPTLYGSPNPELLLVGFGSTYGVMREAVDRLADQHSVAMLHFSELYPFPLTDNFDFPALLRQVPKAVCIENNATGQLARLIRSETGFEFSTSINRYDGRPFSTTGLLGELHGIL